MFISRSLISTIKLDLRSIELQKTSGPQVCKTGLPPILWSFANKNMKHRYGPRGPTWILTLILKEGGQSGEAVPCAQQMQYARAVETHVDGSIVLCDK